MKTVFEAAEVEEATSSTFLSHVLKSTRTK